MTLQSDYPKCMIKPAFQQTTCSKCGDKCAECEMYRWQQRNIQREKETRQAKRKRRKAQ